MRCTFFDLKNLVSICPSVSWVEEQHAAKAGQYEVRFTYEKKDSIDDEEIE